MVPEKIAVNVVCCRNLTPQMVCHLLRHMCWRRSPLTCLYW